MLGEVVKIKYQIIEVFLSFVLFTSQKYGHISLKNMAGRISASLIILGIAFYAPFLSNTQQG